jgi:hypothetical protein
MRSIRKPLLVVAFLGSLVAVPAFAQQSATYPPACDASKVSKGDVDRAHAVYLSGKQFLDESNYDKAISYFNDAYSIDCSVHAILPIIATAYERKGDKAEAVRALEEYLRRVPNASDREHVERRIKNLDDQLAKEPAPAPPAATAPSGATAVPVAAAPTGVPESPAAPPTAGSTEAPTADAQPRPSPSPAPWVLTGIGGAAVIGGVIMLAVGGSDVSSAAAACPTRMLCAQSVASEGNTGRTLQTVGVVTTVAGGAMAVGGLVWGILDIGHVHRERGSTAGGATARRTYVTPVVTPGYAGITLGSSL